MLVKTSTYGSRRFGDSLLQSIDHDSESLTLTDTELLALGSRAP
jgi:hypothetical protein